MINTPRPEGSRACKRPRLADNSAIVHKGTNTSMPDSSLKLCKTTIEMISGSCTACEFSWIFKQRQRDNLQKAPLNTCIFLWYVSLVLRRTHTLHCLLFVLCCQHLCQFHGGCSRNHPAAGVSYSHTALLVQRCVWGFPSPNLPDIAVLACF